MMTNTPARRHRGRGALIDSIWKNIAGYVGWAALAVVIAVLQEVHQQIEGVAPFNGWRLLNAGIVALLPVLIVMLGSMKQPSVGHEVVSDRMVEHEQGLQVDDAPPAWLPPPEESRRVPAPGRADDPTLGPAGAPAPHRRVLVQARPAAAPVPPEGTPHA
jgi:hypothetical protein